MHSMMYAEETEYFSNQKDCYKKLNNFTVLQNYLIYSIQKYTLQFTERSISWLPELSGTFLH